MALPLFADPPQPVVEDAVSDRYRPLELDQEKLVGLLAKRMRANSEGFLEHLDDARLSTVNSNHASPETSGAFPSNGQSLEAAANAYKYRHDAHLRMVIERAAKQLIAAQSDPLSKSNLSPGKPIGRLTALEYKYDILGLLAVYRVTGDEDALVAAVKIGDRLLKMFPKGSVEKFDYLGAAPLVEPFVALYRHTEESRFLEVSKSAADAWIQARVASDDTSADTLSQLNALVDLYRVTGDESYFRLATATWDSIRRNALAITGTPVQGDPVHNHVGDSCGTLTWMQLTLNLLRITGEVGYAEQLERTIYNQLFAGQDGNTGAIFSGVFLEGMKQLANVSDPCVSSEAEGIALIPAAVWGRFGNGIAIFLYNAGRGSFQLSRRRGTVQIYSEAAFPENGEYLLHVEPAHGIHFPLRLRVPEWTSSFNVEIAGSRMTGKPGEYLIINREWKPGDTVKISIDMTARILHGTIEHSEQVALQRGPQVLAISKPLNAQLKDLAEARLLPTDEAHLDLALLTSSLPPSWPGDQAYSIAGEYQGKLQPLVFAPFADARSYRVWLAPPTGTTGASIQ